MTTILVSSVSHKATNNEFDETLIKTSLTYKKGKISIQLQDTLRPSEKIKTHKIPATGFGAVSRRNARRKKGYTSSREQKEKAWNRYKLENPMIIQQHCDQAAIMTNYRRSKMMQEKIKNPCKFTSGAGSWDTTKKLAFDNLVSSKG